MAGKKDAWLPEPWLYLVNRAGIPLIPLALSYRLSSPFSDIVYSLWKSKRDMTRRNYARMFQRSPDDPLIERLSRSCFRHFGRYITEMIHAQGWSEEEASERLDVVGEENFAAAELYGRGIIFTSAHMGSAEVVGSLVTNRGYKITSVSERLRPKMIMDWAVACREAMGVRLLPTWGSGMKLVRALRKKEIVALVVDVGADHGGGVPVTFFGQPTVFPIAPARLARLSGAPILFALAIRKTKGRYTAYVSRPLLSDPKLDPEEDARRITQQIIDIFERFVRRYPDQWYVFRDIWRNGGGKAQISD